MRKQGGHVNNYMAERPFAALQAHVGSLLECIRAAQSDQRGRFNDPLGVRSLELDRSRSSVSYLERSAINTGGSFHESFMKKPVWVYHREYMASCQESLSSPNTPAARIKFDVMVDKL